METALRVELSLIICVHLSLTLAKLDTGSGTYFSPRHEFMGRIAAAASVPPTSEMEWRRYQVTMYMVT